MKAVISFRRDEAGAVLAEFAVVLPLFLILLFSILDFGQIYFRWILAEKATQIAARLAVVRPPLCSGVPDFNDRAPGAPADVPFGSSCTEVPGLCANPGIISCSGAVAESDVFDEITAQIGGFLPPSTEPGDIIFAYGFADLGFLGGPYVPMVTVELDENIDVPFVTPLGPLLQAFYGGGPGLTDPSLPSMRATLPAEDLVEGGPG